MRCDRYRRHARRVARNEAEPSPRVQRHLTTCLRCQAEMARERRLQRHMRSMRQESRVPGGLLERIMATIEASAGETPARGGSRTAGVVAGAVAGVLAVGLGTRTGRRVLRLAS